MTARDLPALNAILNASSFLLLTLGYALIRRGRRSAHRAVMLSAVFTSGLFLVSYLTYHALAGSTRFRGQGGLRILYLTILGSHSLLAVAIVPLVLVTLARALGGRLAAHRRLARITLPLWTYVSITGVAIYWMLYRL